MHTQGESVHLSTRDGRTLHSAILPGPSDAPIVVFEAGAGGTRSAWASVQPAVAGFATAVVYDRSGLGRSAPDPRDRTFERMADDLADLLDGLDQLEAAGGARTGGAAARRFVLVGHSLGGLIVRAAAARRADRIAALVLVDPSDEGADGMLRENSGRRATITTTVMRVLAHTGILRIVGGLAFRRAPADVRADIAREASTPRAVATLEQELKNFYPELRSWQRAAPDTAALPVTVISGVKSGGIGKAQRLEFNAAHARRAKAAPSGRHVFAENSGHQVPLTDPELIVEEIRRVVTGSAHAR